MYCFWWNVLVVTEIVFFSTLSSTHKLLLSSCVFSINFLSVPCAVREVRRHVGYRLFLSTVIRWPLHFLFSFLVLFLSVYLSPRSGQSNSWLSSVELFGTWRSIFVLNLLPLSTLKAPEKTTLSTQFQGVGECEKNGNCVCFCWSVNVVLKPLTISPTTSFSVSIGYCINRISVKKNVLFLVECAGGHRNRVFLNSIIDPQAPVVNVRFFYYFSKCPLCSQGGPKTRGLSTVLIHCHLLTDPLSFFFLFLFLSVYLSPRSGQSNSWLSSVELFGTWRSIFVLNLLTLSTLKAPEKTTLSTQFQGTGRLRKERELCLLLLKFKCSF